MEFVLLPLTFYEIKMTQNIHCYHLQINMYMYLSFRKKTMTN